MYIFHKLGDAVLEIVMIIPMYAVMLWQHTKLPGTRDQAARDPEIALALQGELEAG